MHPGFLSVMTLCITFRWNANYSLIFVPQYHSIFRKSISFFYRMQQSDTSSVSSKTSEKKKRRFFPIIKKSSTEIALAFDPRNLENREGREEEKKGSKLEGLKQNKMLLQN